MATVPFEYNSITCWDFAVFLQRASCNCLQTYVLTRQLCIQELKELSEEWKTVSPRFGSIIRVSVGSIQCEGNYLRKWKEFIETKYPPPPPPSPQFRTQSSIFP